MYLNKKACSHYDDNCGKCRCITVNPGKGSKPKRGVIEKGDFGRIKCLNNATNTLQG